MFVLSLSVRGLECSFHTIILFFLFPLFFIIYDIGPVGFKRFSCDPLPFPVCPFPVKQGLFSMGDFILRAAKLDKIFERTNSIWDKNTFFLFFSPLGKLRKENEKKNEEN